jgi:hypothetical protein
MSVCSHCDRLSEVGYSLVLFTGEMNFKAWDLKLCRKCADALPMNISTMLEKEPTK